MSVSGRRAANDRLRLLSPPLWRISEDARSRGGALDRYRRDGAVRCVAWGNGYFSINDDGHVLVLPTKDPARAIDLKELVDQLVLRGIDLPILIRFTEILRHRVGEIHQAFQNAIGEHGYQGKYCCVYPIKVNQQRHVVEEMLQFGRPFEFGLEAGTKPELMAVRREWRRTTRRSSATVSKTRNSLRQRCSPRRWAIHHSCRRKVHRVGKHCALCRKDLRPPDHWRPRETGRQGGGAMEIVGGLPIKFGLTLSEILRSLENLKQRGMADCFNFFTSIWGARSPTSARSKAP